MKKIILTIIGIIVIASATYVTYQGWDNTKLQLTRYWGYLTLTNNPLLPSKDKDLQALQGTNKKGQIKTRIALSEILPGGPPKDGIPAIDKPRFVSPDKTPFKDNAIVIGVYLNGEARAYPYGILNWHEIVNDTIKGTPITVTYCPLCDTNPVFIRKVNGKITTFGISGKLFQSCLVMYDRLTDSLWVQPWGIAVAGKQTNQILQRIPAIKTTLGQWKSKYPNTKVLSTNTGYQRNYLRNPYGNYDTNNTLIFPVRNQAKLKVHVKTIQTYIWHADNKTPFNQFSGPSYVITNDKMKQLKNLTIMFNNKKVNVVWDNQLGAVRFYHKGKEIPASTAFGFVYPAFFE